MNSFDSRSIRWAAIRAIVVVAIASNAAIPQEPQTLTDSQWRADFDQLVTLIREEHVNPFWLASKEEFEAAVSQAQKALAIDAAVESRVATMMRVIASIRDGHSVLAAPDRYRTLGYLPFSVESYADGLYVRRTTRANEHLLGARLESIDGVNIDQVIERLRPYVPAATENRFRRWLPSYLHLPGLLRAAGVSNSPTVASLEFSVNGKRERVVFSHLPPDKEKQTEFVTFLDRLDPVPRRYRKRDAPYWFEHLPQQNAVYFNYNRVRSDESESAWAFGDRLFSFLEDKDVSRLVVDLRDNGGGGYQYGAHFWEGIKNLDKINRRGHLFVITGKKTFSAAIDVALKLRMQTEAIFVGEEPADFLASPGDDDDEKLDNSGLTVRLSRQFHSIPLFGAVPQTLEPDYVIPETFADLRAGRDPALNFALTAAMPEQHARLDHAARFMGRFRFTPDISLVIKTDGEGLVATAVPGLDMRLYPSGPGTFRTAWEALTLEFQPNGELIARLGSTRKALPRLDADTQTPWELLYGGKFDQARSAFEKLQKSNRDLPCFGDGELSTQAIHVYNALRTRFDKDTAKKAARQLLDMGIRFNDGKAPNCEFALRFYQ